MDFLKKMRPAMTGKMITEDALLTVKELKKGLFASKGLHMINLPVLRTQESTRRHFLLTESTKSVTMEIKLIMMAAISSTREK